MAVTIPTVSAVVLGTGTTTVYTVTNTAAKYYMTKTILLCNTTALAVTVSLYKVPTGGSINDNNALWKNLPLAAYETVVISEQITFGQNESLRGTCSSATSCTVHLSGGGEL